MSLAIFIVFMLFMAKPLCQFLDGMRQDKEGEKRERELEMIRKSFLVEKERRVERSEWEALSKRAVRLTAHTLRD